MLKRNFLILTIQLGLFLPITIFSAGNGIIGGGGDDGNLELLYANYQFSSDDEVEQQQFVGNDDHQDSDDNDDDNDNDNDDNVDEETPEPPLVFASPPALRELPQFQPEHQNIESVGEVQQQQQQYVESAPRVASAISQARQLMNAAIQLHSPLNQQQLQNLLAVTSSGRPIVPPFLEAAQQQSPTHQQQQQQQNFSEASLRSPEPTIQSSSLICPGAPIAHGTVYDSVLDFLFDAPLPRNYLSRRTSSIRPYLENDEQRKERLIEEITKSQTNEEKDTIIVGALSTFKFKKIYFEFFLRCTLSPSTLEERLISYFASFGSNPNSIGSFLSVFTEEDLPALHRALPLNLVFSSTYWVYLKGEVLSSLLLNFDRKKFNYFCRMIDLDLTGDANQVSFVFSDSFTDVKNGNWLHIGLDQITFIFKYFRDVDIFRFYESIGMQLLFDAPPSYTIEQWNSLRAIWLLRFRILIEESPKSFFAYCFTKYKDENYNLISYQSADIAESKEEYELEETKNDSYDYAPTQSFINYLSSSISRGLHQPSPSFTFYEADVSINFTYEKHPVVKALLEEQPFLIPSFSSRYNNFTSDQRKSFITVDMMPFSNATKSHPLHRELLVEFMKFFTVPVEQMNLYVEESSLALNFLSSDCFFPFDVQYNLYNVWRNRHLLSPDSPILNWLNAKLLQFYDVFWSQVFASKSFFKLNGYGFLLLPIYLERIASYRSNSQYYKFINSLLHFQRNPKKTPPSLEITPPSSSSEPLPTVFARKTLAYSMDNLRSPHLKVNYQTAIDEGGPQKMWIENLFRFFCFFDDSSVESSSSSSYSSMNSPTSTVEYTKIVENSLGKRTFLPFLDKSIGKLAGITWAKAYQQGLKAPFMLDPAFWSLVLSPCSPTFNVASDCKDYFFKNYKQELNNLWYTRLYEPKEDSRFPLSLYKEQFEESLKDHILLPKPEGVTFRTIDSNSNLLEAVDCESLSAEQQMLYYSSSEVDWATRPNIYKEFVDRSLEEFVSFVTEFRAAFHSILPFSPAVYSAFKNITISAKHVKKRHFLYLLEGSEDFSMQKIISIFTSKLQVCKTDLQWTIPSEPVYTFPLIKVVTTFLKNLSPCQFERFFLIWSGCSISLFNWAEPSSFKVYTQQSYGRRKGYTAAQLEEELAPPPPAPVNLKKRNLEMIEGFDDADCEDGRMSMEEDEENEVKDEEEGDRQIVRKTRRYVYFETSVRQSLQTLALPPTLLPTLQQPVSPPNSIDSNESSDSIVNGRDFCNLMNAVSKELIGREVVNVDHPFSLSYDFLGDGTFELPKFSTCFKELKITRSSVPSVIHSLYLSLNQCTDEMFDGDNN